MVILGWLCGIDNGVCTILKGQGLSSNVENKNVQFTASPPQLLVP